MRARIATAWLGGCSGCHMTLLDLDERLLSLCERADFVFGPFLDVKDPPDRIDVALVEGAVANEDHLPLLRRIRARSRICVALGDCAVSGNVTAIRNSLGGASVVLDRVFRGGGGSAEREETVAAPRAPGILPELLDRVLPLHQVVRVDHFLPGCPPAADLVHGLLDALIDGRSPAPHGLRFG